MLTSPPWEAMKARSAASRLRHSGGRGIRAKASVVVLNREQAAGFERPDQLLEVRLGVREEQEHPAREDHVVPTRQRCGHELGLPDPARAQAVARAQRLEPRGEGRRALDGIHWPTDAAPQLEVQGALSWADFQDLPAAPDAEAVEERDGRRIPEPGLRSQPGRLTSRVA